MILLDWLKRKWREYVVCLVLLLSFNLYFIYLMRTAQITYLLYLDFLLLVFLAVVEGMAFLGFWKKERRKKVFLQEDELVYEALDRPEDSAVFVHDMGILERHIQEKFDENYDLQDYVAKWCHEFKIPLSAALLIAAKIKDADVRADMREQLERLNWQMSMMLQGCRLQSPLFDLQVKQVSLEKCVRDSIRNNQFFLIQQKFRLDVQISDVIIYTDETWFTYILDQILNNAVKYARPEEEHYIRFWMELLPGQAALGESFEETVQMKLYIEDNGEGIRESDIRRVFEKGYTGSNNHNGKYKSTGMGLYMAEKIAKRLGHTISVESSYGEYTCFCILLRGK